MIQRQWLSYKGMSGPMVIIYWQVRPCGHTKAALGLWLSLKGSPKFVVIRQRLIKACLLSHKGRSEFGYHTKAGQGFWSLIGRSRL